MYLQDGDQGVVGSYCPVAVTPQVSVKVIVVALGSTGIVKPAPKKLAIFNPGQVPPGVVAQVKGPARQLSPSLGTSLTTAPDASAGPALLTTMV